MHTSIRRFTLTMGASALMLNTGCYSYARVAPGEAAPIVAQLVRIRLTSEGTTELARYLGPRVVEVEGTFSRAGQEGALVVGPEWVKLADGLRQPWSGEGVVTIPLKFTQGMEQRTFDRRKTIIATVAAVVSTVAIALLAFGSISSKGDGTSPPPPPPP